MAVSNVDSDNYSSDSSGTPSDYVVYDHLDCSEQEYYTKFTRELLWKGFLYSGSGSFRRGYERKNLIVKVPITRDGILDNYMEAKAWRKYKNNPTSLGILLAPCRLLSNYCLIMPRLERTYDTGNLPSWVDSVDREQVGFRNGRVMAFDYAIDLQERLKWEMDLKIKNTFFQRTYINRKYNDHLNVIKG